MPAIFPFIFFDGTGTANPYLCLCRRRDEKQPMRYLPEFSLSDRDGDGFDWGDVGRGWIENGKGVHSEIG